MNHKCLAMLKKNLAMEKKIFFNCLSKTISYVGRYRIYHKMLLTKR